MPKADDDNVEENILESLSQISSINKGRKRKIPDDDWDEVPETQHQESVKHLDEVPSDAEPKATIAIDPTIPFILNIGDTIGYVDPVRTIIMQNNLHI